jgi:methylenetetrahydrofolate dehydrogenase (NADP+)/methenyltetrahydrofolate cyclohydrolase
MAELLKGKAVAEAIGLRSIEGVNQLKENGISPTLALFRVGNREDDVSYERGAMKRCAETGVEVIRYIFDEGVSEEEFYQSLEDANRNDAIHGILVFRPLPKRFNDEKLRNSIRPEKDVDGCSDLSLAGVFTDKELGFAPCTAQSVIEMLDHYQIDLKGKNVAVIGRSLVIGKPVSMLLLKRNATVTICHSRSSDLAAIASRADILVCATGKAEMIDRSYTNPEQIIIDVGISWNDEKQKLCGDVLFDDVADHVSAISPVPGGIGSVTTAVLVSHVVEAALRKNKIK